MFIGDWLGKRARLSPNKTAIIDTITGQEFTYRQWNEQANRTANYLVNELGIGKGDRVAVLAMNCQEYLDIWFACGKIGAVLQNLNWRLAVPELIAIIQDAGPQALVYGGDFTAQVNRLRPRLSGVRYFVALDAQADPGDRLLAARDEQPARPPEEPELDWDDPWVICYTGGTTGLPKGAILTHGNITWNAVNTVTSWGLRPDDVAILNAPLFHTGGLNVFTAPLVHLGGTSILCRGFDVEQVFDLIENAGVTLFFGVPTMFIMMQQHPRWDDVDFGGCRIVISGGAPCPRPVFERFWAKGVDFKTGYGLTEAGPNTFWLPPEDVRRKPGAVGFPLMHIDVKLIGEDGQACEPDQVGELLIRGPHVTPGYWNNPAATAQAIRDGWLHTGDLAVQDGEGYITIVGRSKEMFISGGENVYPAEVESVMYGHPAVAEAALIGVPHETWGEVGHAFVVVRAGAQLTEEELLSYLRERLAAYKIPKIVSFLDELPKTGAGKIDKQALARR
jgi:fatty-acyl-CoA synthase